MSDLILTNASVYTVDPDRPRAEAVAVRDGTILRVGSAAEVGAEAGPARETIDLRGALVLPGFIDSHTHFLTGGAALSGVQLRDVTSREAFRARIAARVETIEPGEWILNGDWDHQSFTPPELPDRSWIDDLTPDNPVCVTRFDGHMALVNAAALKMAGLTRATPEPPGGEIHKDPASGELTGILKDAAMDPVFALVAEPSLKERIRAAEAALRLAAERGLTSIHDMSDAASFETYQEMRRSGRLTARLAVYIPITEVDLLARLRLRGPFGDDLLKLAGLKGFMDGSLGSATAYFFEPYTDDPSTRGILNAQMFPEGIMEKRILAADRAGLQVAVHAIGDRANAMLLDIYEKALAAHGPRERRWRIEHAQHLRPSDIGRIGRLGVIGSVQPYHAVDDGRWAETKIGRERCRTTYAFRSLLDSGVSLAFGSDWTVSPLDPLAGIQAAVTRATIDGRTPGGWFPEQRISVEEAVYGYTMGGAFAEFAEGRKGSIREGKLADLVVLDRDIFRESPERIKDAHVLLTVLGGKIVYRR
ncbi:MAG: amidohydrolase [Candidatus Aminicenantes bacterium]|nr:amidohydrolase [Candidatus Aminicenantes bacterium]